MNRRTDCCGWVKAAILSKGSVLAAGGHPAWSPGFSRQRDRKFWRAGTSRTHHRLKPGLHALSAPGRTKHTVQMDSSPLPCPVNRLFPTWVPFGSRSRYFPAANFVATFVETFVATARDDKGFDKGGARDAGAKRVRSRVLMRGGTLEHLGCA